mmetsp:Transcript_30007/g.45507  ORF Transcript_30007/g.45507 Transcript_30007/m.45507 type:complete len:86 (+) Transcript_30007:75-332(+)
MMNSFFSAYSKYAGEVNSLEEKASSESTMPRVASESSLPPPAAPGAVYSLDNMKGYLNNHSCSPEQQHAQSLAGVEVFSIFASLD